jgi:excisionase family DNA binding protein
VDLEAAAAVLGVHYQTAYRWVRSGTLPAVKVGSGYELDRATVEALALERGPYRAATPPVTPDWTAVCDELTAHLLAGDDTAARQLCDRLHGTGIPAKTVWASLIVPAIRRLEDGATAGSLPPADFVAASDTCERLAGLLVAPPRGRPRGLAIVASPEGERRRLPSLVTTALLRADRWRVHHLGCHVPAVDLAEFIEETLPELVVVSVADTSAATAEFCRTVEGAAGVPILVHCYLAPTSPLLEGLDDMRRRKPRPSRDSAAISLA